jgi:hypothetical protein
MTKGVKKRFRTTKITKRTKTPHVQNPLRPWRAKPWRPWRERLLPVIAPSPIATLRVLSVQKTPPTPLLPILFDFWNYIFVKPQLLIFINYGSCFFFWGLGGNRNAHNTFWEKAKCRN